MTYSGVRVSGILKNKCFLKKSKPPPRPRDVTSDALAAVPRDPMTQRVIPSPSGFACPWPAIPSPNGLLWPLIHPLGATWPHRFAAAACSLGARRRDDPRCMGAARSRGAKHNPCQRSDGAGWGRRPMGSRRGGPANNFLFFQRTLIPIGLSTHVVAQTQTTC